MTRTIVYTSDVRLPHGMDTNESPDWMDALVDQANKKNKLLNITGVLSFKEGKFIQLIEGDSDKLQGLFDKILKDSRHQNISLLLDIKDSTRVFSKWNMILDPNIETSSLFREFLFTHFDNLVDMSEQHSNKLIFFIDKVFHEIIDSKTV